MAVQVNAPAFLELVDEDAELERLGTGFTFTEGPIWNPDGFLLFSDMPGDVRRRWDPESGVTEVANPSNKGNGMTLDHDGRLLVCEHVTSSVVRMDPDGTGGGREVLATHYEGQRAQQPQRRRGQERRRDLLHRPDLRAHARLRDRARAGPRLPGRLPHRAGRRRPAAADRRLRPAQRAVLLDRRVAALHQRHRRARTSASSTSPADGTIANGRVLADGIGSGSLEIGDLVDGMKLDERGNVWVTGPGRRVRLRSRRASTSAPSRSPRTSATSTGAGPTGTSSSSRRRPRCTASSARSPATDSPT